MPFYINHTNGTSLATVQDGSVDSTSTSITLIGKNFPTYGQYLNQNLISLLENSANTTAPDPALLGQLWYDSTNKNISFYREGSVENAWKKLAMTSEGPTAPVDPRLGDLWWDSNTSQLKLYDTVNSTWKIIGPQTTNDGKLNVSGGSFKLQVGGNTVLSLDINGGLTLSKNACVAGYNHTSGTTMSTAGVTNYQAWVPIVTINTASNFNTTTGIFTVKTAGIYEVYAHVSALNAVGAGATDGTAVLKWQLNGSETGINGVAQFASTSQTLHDQIVCRGLVYAPVSSTIQLVYATANAGTLIDYQNSSYSIRLVQ